MMSSEETSLAIVTNSCTLVPIGVRIAGILNVTLRLTSKGLRKKCWSKYPAESRWSWSVSFFHREAKNTHKVGPRGSVSTSNLRRLQAMDSTMCAFGDFYAIDF